MTNKTIHRMTWLGVEDALNDFADICTQGYFKQILCVSRGGLSIGGLLGYLLDIRKVASFCCEGYAGQKIQSVLKVTHCPDVFEFNSPYTLVVDDIADSGRTMNTIQRVYPEAMRYALVGKPSGIPFVHRHGVSIDQDVWVEFPWEIKKRAPRNIVTQMPESPQ